MVILPRPHPLYENISARKVHLPDAIKKLGAGGFTGYLGYGSPTAEGYFIFIHGALISTLMLHGNSRKTGFEAFNSLFNHAIVDGGAINVYLMTADIAACTHAILHGDSMVKPEKVKDIDLMALLARLKMQQHTGTVLFSTIDRCAMIFYKDGTPVGFYHDGASEVELSPAESQKVASLPDAVVEVRIATPAASLVQHNFLETLNIDRLWQAIQNRHKASQPQAIKSDQPEKTTPAATSMSAPEIAPHPLIQPADSLQLKELVEDLHEIARAYLGRKGADLVDQLLASAGGPSLLYDASCTRNFLATLTSEAPSLDPEAKIEEMTDLMQSEVAGRLAL